MIIKKNNLEKIIEVFKIVGRTIRSDYLGYEIFKKSKSYKDKIKKPTDYK